MKRKKLNLHNLKVFSFITASERNFLRAGVMKEAEEVWSEPGPCECTCECSGCLRN